MLTTFGCNGKAGGDTDVKKKKDTHQDKQSHNEGGIDGIRYKIFVWKGGTDYVGVKTILPFAVTTLTIIITIPYLSES